MTNVVFFHSVYGLRPAVLTAAARLRAAGHTVETPDLFLGRTADDLDSAMAIRREIGTSTLMLRARAAVADLPPGSVLAGYSFGASVAQDLGIADPRVAGLLLLHGVGDVPDEVTPGLPVQLHIATGDDFAPPEEVAPWRAVLEKHGAQVEVYEYTGGGHLYTDPDLPDHHAPSAEETWRRAEAFLVTVGEPHGGPAWGRSGAAPAG